MSPFLKYGVRIERGFPGVDFFSKRSAVESQYLDLYHTAKDTQLAIWANVRDHLESCGVETLDVPVEYISQLACNIQISVKKSQPNWVHGFVLWALLSDIIKRNGFTNWLEVGTAKGFSAAVLESAGRDSRCAGISIDVLPHEDRMVWNCRTDKYGPRSRRELLEKEIDSMNVVFIQGYSKDVLKRLYAENLGLIFLDGQHTYNAVKFEADWASRVQVRGDWLVFDDCSEHRFPGVWKAVSEFRKEGKYDVNFLDLGEGRQFAICRKR